MTALRFLSEKYTLSGAIVMPMPITDLEAALREAFPDADIRIERSFPCDPPRAAGRGRWNMGSGASTSFYKTILLAAAVALAGTSQSLAAGQTVTVSGDSKPSEGGK